MLKRFKYGISVHFAVDRWLQIADMNNNIILIEIYESLYRRVSCIKAFNSGRTVGYIASLCPLTAIVKKRGRYHKLTYVVG